jgi:hypothetical protein
MVRAISAFTLVLVAAVLWPVAEGQARSRTNQVRALYVPPKNAIHEPIHRTLKGLRALERLAQVLSPLRLPRRLTLKLDECDGAVNAYYEDDVVLVCYEYLEFVHQSVLSAKTTYGISTRAAIVGPTIDVFLHETGHAVFDMLKIPVLGREEDAADLFSAYLMLQLAPDDAHTVLSGVAFLGATEAMAAQKENLSLREFADEHGLPAQRYFNVLCLAYGANPKTFADAVTLGRLSKERAEGCEAEYRQFDYAFRRLIAPHVSRRLVRKVRATRWFRF